MIDATDLENQNSKLVAEPGTEESQLLRQQEVEEPQIT